MSPPTSGPTKIDNIMSYKENVKGVMYVQVRFVMKGFVAEFVPTLCCRQAVRH